MSTYIKVYSPDNEVFEVTRYIADSLILEHNWTQNPIKTLQPKEETRYIADSLILEHNLTQNSIKTLQPKEEIKTSSVSDESSDK